MIANVPLQISPICLKESRNSEKSVVTSQSFGGLTICDFLFSICDLIFVGQLERKIANIKSQIENIKSPDYCLRSTDL